MSTSFVIRYNVSQNDREGIYFYGFERNQEARDIHIYNNTHFVRQGLDVSVFPEGRTPLNSRFENNLFFFEGMKWFEEVLTSERFHASLLRQLQFTFIILAIQVPLGVSIALAMPRKGPWVSVCLVLMALPLLIPWNVVGAMWNIFALPEIGLLGYTLISMGIDYNFTNQPVSAWLTTVVMDV